MKYYYQLIAERETAKENISKHKRYLNKRLRSLNKTTFRLLIFAVIMIVLFNFGAFFLTNLMVVRNNSLNNVETVLYEVNPVAVVEQNMITDTENHYVEHPQSQQLMNTLLLWIVKWTVTICFFVYYVRNVITEDGLTILCIITLGWFFILGWDFFNNFGFFIGKLVFGG